MTGRFIDTLRYRGRTPLEKEGGIVYVDTDFGVIRVFDNGGNKPVIINVPDGPNVIEHQHTIKDYRCAYSTDMGSQGFHASEA